VDCYAADIRLSLSGAVHRTSTGQSRPLTAGAQGLVQAVYGVLVQHFRVPVDHKRFRMARRSTAHDGHPRGVSTVQVPQGEAKRADTVDHPLSKLHGYYDYVRFQRFLGLQRRHIRSTIFGIGTLTNSIRPFG
jgi:hypothetical protein